ncbi:MAG TPA: hypothetical protein VIV60_37410, partial [Polyangiaceae bacterium]
MQGHFITWGFSALLLGVVCGYPLAASAQTKQVLVLPTSVGEQIDCDSAARSAVPVDPAWTALARRIDGLVADAVEDAGMESEIRVTASMEPAERKGCVEEPALHALAKQGLVLAPRLLFRSNQMYLRISAAVPNSSVLRVATQEVSGKDVDFRTVVLVSELLTADNAHGETTKQIATPSIASTNAPKSRSQGKGVLALTSAILGGGIGYSLQRASGGSDEPRLTYPLIALGTGIGIGASLIAAEEWDLSTGEAWYLNAGMVWPTTSGLMLAYTYNNVKASDRYIYGLGGATAGMALAAFALNFAEITEGGALFAHSGGALGLLLGGLTEMTYRGNTTDVPYRGMGYGTAIGVVLAGAAATQVQVSSSRVLFIDLSAGLGALTGAALGSVTMFVDDNT